MVNWSVYLEILENFWSVGSAYPEILENFSRVGLAYPRILENFSTDGLAYSKILKNFLIVGSVYPEILENFLRVSYQLITVYLFRIYRYTYACFKRFLKSSILVFNPIGAFSP